MQRTAHAGAFLVVEGDDDHASWKPRVAVTCSLVLGSGKSSVVGALDRLDRDPAMAGVLGIVDDDWDTLEGRPPVSPNVIATDTHDLEMLLLRSRALDKVLAELADARKVDAFVAARGPVRQAVLACALPHGRLRWLSLRQGWAVPFERIPIQRFLTPSHTAVDMGALLETACAEGAPCTLAELRALLERLPGGDPWLVCHGHDAVAVLRALLSKPLRRDKGAGLALERALRLAFEAADLEASRLGHDVRAWQTRTGYTVLAG